MKKNEVVIALRTDILKAESAGLIKHEQIGFYVGVEGRIILSEKACLTKVIEVIEYLKDNYGDTFIFERHEWIYDDAPPTISYRIVER